MTSTKKAAWVILGFVGIFVLSFIGLLGYEIWNKVVWLLGGMANAFGR
jgi:hypothetical protein